jgi:hypothetical protein
MQIIRERAFFVSDTLHDITALIQTLNHTSTVMAHLPNRAAQPPAYQR